MLNKPTAVISAVIAMIVTQAAPYLGTWGLPEDVAQDIANWLGAGIWALTSVLWYIVTSREQLAEYAGIVVAAVEAGSPGADGATKKALAVARLNNLIDAMPGNVISRGLLKMFAAQTIEMVVARTKELLYTKPPDDLPAALPEILPKVSKV